MSKGYQAVRKPVGANWILVMGTVVLVMVTVGNVGITRAATATDFPLEPPDTSSPRATMDSFLSNMQEAHKAFREASKRYEEEGGWYPSDDVQAERERAFIFFRRAKRCLDLSQVPSTLLDRVGAQSTVLLKTIFDRISIPALETIPDADEMNVEERSRWRLPHTEIEIAKVLEGPRSGEFLFSPATVNRLEEDYDRIKHIPPQTWGMGGGLHLVHRDEWIHYPRQIDLSLSELGKKSVFRSPIMEVDCAGLAACRDWHGLDPGSPPESWASE